MYNRELYKHPKIIIPSMTIVNWAGFGNQPDGDGLEIVSNSASDVGLCTVWGTLKTTGAFKYETVTLTGTSAVSTLETDWDDIYSVFLGDAFGRSITPAVGTITLREASADQAVTTLTAGVFNKGMFFIHAKGLNVEVHNTSGKIYWNVNKVATAVNGLYNVGTAFKQYNIGVSDYLSIISDNSGCVTQIVVMED